MTAPRCRFAVLALLLPGLLGLGLGSGPDLALRQTVLLTPGVLGLLTLSGHLAGRPLHPVRLGLGATGLVLLAFALSSSALPFAPLLAGSLLLVGLIGALFQSALRIRAGLVGGQRCWRLPAAAGAVALAGYLAAVPWHVAQRHPNGDEPYYLLLAWSLAHDRDLNLANQYQEGVALRWGLERLEPQPGDPTGPAGEIYSRHDPLYPLWLAPFLALGGVPAARFANTLLAALGSALFLAVARKLPGVTPRGAFRSWALFSFLSPWPLYAAQLWVETAAGTLLLLALAPFLSQPMATQGAAGRATLQSLCALSGLIALKLRLALLGVPTAVVVLGSLAQRPGLQLRLALGVLFVAAGVLAGNFLAFGNPLKLYGVEALWPESAAPLQGLAGLFLDGTFGLIAIAPVCLFAVPAVARELLSPRQNPLGLWLWAAVPYLVAIAARREWYGGWSPPFRYALVLLPLLLLAWARQASRASSRAGRLLGPAATLGTMTLLGLYTLQPEWAYHLANGSHHLLDQFSPRFEADLLRFLPSAIRPNRALFVAASGLVLLFAASLGLRSRIQGYRLLNLGLKGPASLALALTLPTLWLAAAHYLPTRVLELEDPHVRSRGAGIYPELWLPDRTRFPGALILPEGAEAWTRPVAGGNAVVLTLHWSRIENDATPLALEVWSNDQLAARLAPPPTDTFTTARIGPLSWHPGSVLRFRTSAPDGSPPRNGLVLDRVQFHWQ